MTGSLVLLGPQRPRPNAPDALERHSAGRNGTVVVLSAGWRADETDDEPLRRHLGPDVAVLPIYTWFEVVMRELPELRADYRLRQDEFARMRKLHRLRLNAALESWGAVRDDRRVEGDPLADEAMQQALEDVRRIDHQLLEGASRITASHQRASQPWEQHPVVSRLKERAHQLLREARAVVITGGHVAVLLNRLQFFGIDVVLRELHGAGTPILAWSAGSMVLTERIVLFYDDPPDGQAYPELLDRGFGLVKDLVLLPHAKQRLRLEDPRRVALLASRFAPAVCLGLDNGSALQLRDGEWWNRGIQGTAVRLHPDGRVTDLPHELETPRPGDRR
jgi:hypothetical protein